MFSRFVIRFSLLLGFLFFNLGFQVRFRFYVIGELNKFVGIRGFVNVYQKRIFFGFSLGIQFFVYILRYNLSREFLVFQVLGCYGSKCFIRQLFQSYFFLRVRGGDGFGWLFCLFYNFWQVVRVGAGRGEEFWIVFRTDFG